MFHSDSTALVEMTSKLLTPPRMAMGTTARSTSAGGGGTHIVQEQATNQSLMTRQ